MNEYPSCNFISFMLIQVNIFRYAAIHKDGIIKWFKIKNNTDGPDIHIAHEFLEICHIKHVNYHWTLLDIFIRLYTTKAVIKWQLLLNVLCYCHIYAHYKAKRPKVMIKKWNMNHSLGSRRVSKLHHRRQISLIILTQNLSTKTFLEKHC